MRETPEAARAFEQYYSLGDDRTLLMLAQKRFAEILGKDQEDTKKTPSVATILRHLKGWSTEHKWQERIIALDKAEAEKARKKRDKAIDAMNERHAGIGVHYQTKAIEKIKKLLEDEAFSPADAIRLLKMATDLERVARGAPTEHTEHSGPGGGPLQHSIEIYKIRLPDNGRDVEQGGNEA